LRVRGGVGRGKRLSPVWAAAFLLALTGCTLNRPPVVKQTYLLEAERPDSSAQTLPVSVRVGAFSVAPPFEGKGLVYRLDDSRYESDFYHEFFVSPRAMAADRTTRWLRQSGLFRDVLAVGVSGDADYLLEGHVSELYLDFRDRAKPVAVVSAQFYLSRDGGSGGIALSASLDRRAPLADNSPQAAARALGAAFAGVLADLEARLGQGDLRSGN
jgi:ABC-type uncharacterized transport system, auxiliary component